MCAVLGRGGLVRIVAMEAGKQQHLVGKLHFQEIMQFMIYIINLFGGGGMILKPNHNASQGTAITHPQHLFP